MLGGGKFENGAITGAFGYLFNELGNNAQRGYEATDYSDGTVCNAGGTGACISEGVKPSYILEEMAGVIYAPFRLVAMALSAAEGVEIGTVLPNGIVAGADSLGAAPNLARLGAKFGINANSEVGANILQNLNTPVRDFISQNRQGSILREFPGEHLDSTVGQALQQGGSTVRKLLLDSRFAK